MNKLKNFFLEYWMVIVLPILFGIAAYGAYATRFSNYYADVVSLLVVAFLVTILIHRAEKNNVIK